jgi:hypothetical protein
VEAGQMLGIPVMDHIIITGLNKDDAYSFKQNSLMEEAEVYTTEPVVSEQALKYKTSKEKMKEITDRLEEGIRDIFESGKYQQYLQTMSKFHRYSLNNTILISLQKPDATLVASFNKWRDQFGRNVKKGERGIRIIAPAPYKMKQSMEKIDPRTKKPAKDAQGNTIYEEKEINMQGFKVVSVFDVSQTEGDPLPELASTLEGSVNQYKRLFTALRKSSPVPIDFADLNPSTDGVFNMEKNQITIRSGMSEVQTVSAVVHEIAHAKLHSRQNMPDNNNPNSQLPDNHTREVEAESVSFAVCSALGIETNDNSFGYIAAWSRDKELPELRASLERISKTASELIDDITVNLETLAKDEPAAEYAPDEASVSIHDESLIMNKQYPDNMIDPIAVNGAYQIYQIKAEPHLKYHRFTSLKKLRAMDEDVDINNYNRVYQSSLTPADKVTDNLDAIFEKFNVDRPEDYRGYSLSVSDVIVIKHSDLVKAYYVDDIGFKEIPNFLEDSDIKRSGEKLQTTNCHDDTLRNKQQKEPVQREKASLKNQLKDTFQKRSVSKPNELSKESSIER